MGFYGSSDPTNNVEALKENMQYEKTKYTNESMHSKMGALWQNPIQRTVRTAHLSVLMTVHSFSTQQNKPNLN